MMPLIISPRIQPWVRKTVTDFFSAKRQRAKFWHSAFEEFFYKSILENNEELFIIFTGYGQLSVAAAVIYEYHRLFQKKENNPRAFFVGSCVVTTKSEADLNDIVVPTRAFTESALAAEISSRFLASNPLRDPWGFNADLISKTKRIAANKKLRIYEGQIYSNESFFEDFWVQFETDWGEKEGYIGGDYECASFVASCNFVGLPMLALLHVTDSRKKGYYTEVPRNAKIEASCRMLDLLRDVIIS
jgi:purine-nucleoside phosphorylase